MADLSFIYGTMESGKTTKLLQDRYNYMKHGHKVVIVKPLIDTKGGDSIVNRQNESVIVDILLAPEDTLITDDNLSIIKDAKVIQVDEAQFLQEKQVIELWKIAHSTNIHVLCYGLKADFLGRPFTGSVALFGYADTKCELTVNCECGETAVFNARMVDGIFVTEGDVVAIDGEHNVSYIPLCSDCYLKYLMPNEQSKIHEKIKG